MKAGVASPNGVVIQDVPEPKPKATDLLIKIKAIALNRAEPTLIVRTEETVGLTRAQMASVDEFVDTYPAKDGYR